MRETNYLILIQLLNIEAVGSSEMLGFDFEPQTPVRTSLYTPYHHSSHNSTIDRAWMFATNDDQDERIITNNLYEVNVCLYLQRNPEMGSEKCWFSTGHRIRIGILKGRGFDFKLKPSGCVQHDLTTTWPDLTSGHSEFRL